MAYSAFAVANAFIERAEQGNIPNLTPMKLQKLLYFAQAWHLKGTQGRPLLDDHFAKWQYGPVVPAIYHEFKAFGASPITRKATTLAVSGNGYAANVPMIPLSDESAWALIDAVIRKYGRFDAQTLSNWTHLTGSAWDKTGEAGDFISHQLIQDDTTIN